MIGNPKLHALTRKFAGYEVIVPAVFGPGDTLTSDAAEWANSQLATVIGNSFGGALRRAREAGKPIDGEGTSFNAQAYFNELFDAWSFGQRKGEGSTARDPVEALVQFLAKEAIKTKIKARNLSVKAFMDTKIDVGGESVSKFTLLVEEYIEKHPELHDTARAQLEAQSAEDDDDLDLSIAAE